MFSTKESTEVSSSYLIPFISSVLNVVDVVSAISAVYVLSNSSFVSSISLATISFSSSSPNVDTIPSSLDIEENRLSSSPSSEYSGKE